MEADSPISQRIGAALKALRQTHPHDSGDATGLAVKCLHAVIAELAASGVPAEDLQPLADLEGFVQRPETASRVASQGPDPLPAQTPRPVRDMSAAQRERRLAMPPSDTLLARASVMIDLLVRSGRDESAAAQTAMRQLIAAGISAPVRGGDSRGWRRLLDFRKTMLQGGGPPDAQHEYRAFARELEAIPPAERVPRLLNERLWDRRDRPR